MKRKGKHQDTKFPVMRVKKIMQTNNEIGKIADLTPLFISKALELFIADVTKKAANEMFTHGHSKVTPSHLKAVIDKEESFAFMRDQVRKIPPLEHIKKPGESRRKGKAKSKEEVKEEEPKKQGGKKQAKGSGKKRTVSQRESVLEVVNEEVEEENEGDEEDDEDFLEEIKNMKVPAKK